MRPIGFCTGAVARGDFRRGLAILEASGMRAVEISAHRISELEDLVRFAAEKRQMPFQHVSIHAPSAFGREEEARIVDTLLKHVPADWPIVMHPDALGLDERWRALGPRLCLENMDKRKPQGRTAEEMRAVFERFPDATFCFDIGHARQIDPTMREAERLLTRFRDRLREVHFSEVDADSAHHRVSPEASEDFRKVVHLIPPDIPIILETDLDEADIGAEFQRACETFGA